MSGDYHTTIQAMEQRNPNPNHPFIICPKCKGDFREIYARNDDGTLSRGKKKVAELQCIDCDFLLSDIKQPKQST